MTAAEIQNIMLLVATGNPAAAEAVHKLADELRAVAFRLESSGNPTRSTGGMDDKVRMQVVGPDGKVKHDTEPQTKGDGR